MKFDKNFCKTNPIQNFFYGILLIIIVLIVVVLPVTLMGIYIYQDATIANTIDAGIVIDIQPIVRHFGGQTKTKIETTKGIFIIEGNIFAIKNNKITIYTYKSGRRYLFIDGTQKGRLIL